MKIILHIGMPKTGSSSIQQSLRSYDHDGVRYAELGHPNHSVGLFTAFSEKRYAYHIHQNRGFSAEKIDHLAKKFRSALQNELHLRRDVLILSGEAMSAMNTEDLKSLKEFCDPFASDYSVIAYCRSPSGFMSSSLQQCIKNGRLRESIPQPRYKARFSSAIDVFGVDSVELLEFTSSKLQAGSVVQDFSSRLALKTQHIKEVRSNDSLPLEAAKLLLYFNQHGIQSLGSSDHVKSRRKMIEILRRHFKGPSFKLPPGVVGGEIDVEDVNWLYHSYRIDFRDEITDNIPPISYETYKEELLRIPSSTVESLKTLLEKLSIPSQESNDPGELMSGLFQHCFSSFTLNRVS